MNNKWSTLRRVRDNFSAFFDQSFECELCLEPTNSKIGVCQSCLARLPFPEYTCSRCSEATSTPGICGKCQKQPPSFDYSVCSLNYEHPIQYWIQRCKDRRDHKQIARLASIMTMAAPMLIEEPDIVTCIPTTHQRRLIRGFNLSEELAGHCAKYLGLPFYPQLLKKTRSADKRRRSARERNEQPSGLTYRNTSSAPNLEGRRVLIIDDVMTTGSTLEEAAKILKSHGAISVGGWCLARTPKPR